MHATTRKRRLDEVPWAGDVYLTINKQVTKIVTQEKWDKGKDFVKVSSEDVFKNPDKPILYKRLERIRGFLCHLEMLYGVVFSCLKVFNPTLSSHLPQRDD